MAPNLDEQISQLKKRKWVNLHGLVTCATDTLRQLNEGNDKSAKGGITCTSISTLGRGSYNIVYKLEFDDGTQVAASVSNADDEDFDEASKRSEVETMKFVRESGLYPDVPVPKVYGYDTTFSNAACAPYVLMEVVQGVTLDGLKAKDGLRGLDTLPHPQQILIVKVLAKLQASLSRPVPFDIIGSITVNDDGKHIIGPLFSMTHPLGGPFKSIDALWRAQLENAILHALREWCSIDTDEISQSLSEPSCTPQTFAEQLQVLSALIPHFVPPKEYLPLVLHHPDLALRNIFFDETSLKSGEPRITGIIDWGGAQILPLMFSAKYPDDLMTTGDEPIKREEYPDEDWRTVPCDWTSLGDTSKWPVAYRGPGIVDDDKPRARAMVGRFYLRTYFSACFAEQLLTLHGDSDLARATLFADAPYYLKFHETICLGWPHWVEHSSWIRETYWRMRMMGQGTGGASGSQVVGPNVYRSTIQPAVRSLAIPEEVRAGDLHDTGE